MAYLFEERYRCEHILPRGSSGEVIQAYDMADGERPVIIKRPVPRDAPPIRGRQEANLLAERRALRHLAGHPALILLLRSDYFAVSGARHLYLVLERARGDVLSEEVRQQSATGQPQALLELLHIVDQLLDLLRYAHEHGVAYNDVAARHLFWLRQERRLTVIDWGNAVFFDEAPPNDRRVGPHSDIAQVGAWLFHMLTKGRAPELPRAANEQFELDFGAEANVLDENLRAIISRACHPNRQHRYTSIADLRSALAAYRKPLAEQQEAAIRELTAQPPETMSATELSAARAQLEPLWLADPSEPTANALRVQFAARATELAYDEHMRALLRALSAGDWQTSEERLATLLDGASKEQRSVVTSLRECVRFLQKRANILAPLPAPIVIACEALAVGESRAAVEALIASDANAEPGVTCWLLAERLQAVAPAAGEFLRPPLFRLHQELQGSANSRLQLLIDDLENALNQQRPTLAHLAAAYETAAAACASLGEDAKLVDAELHACLERVRVAAATIAETLRKMTSKASVAPTAALDDLARCQQIDQRARAWPIIEQQLGALAHHEEEAQRYASIDDSRDLALWLRRQSEALAAIHIFTDDKRLEAQRSAYAQAEQHWQDLTAALTRGDRRSINQALSLMRAAARPFFPALTRWLEAWQDLLASENYLQRHALHEAWGRALGDGWLAYDRGNLAAAESNAAEALSLARDDSETAAATRLATLLSLAQDLLTDSVGEDVSFARQLLQQLEVQFQPIERELLDEFARQIPQRSTYLRAMRVGIVEPLAEIDPAASRLLHLRFLLHGILAMHENDAAAAEDWRQAAGQCLLAAAHPTNRSLMQLLAARETLWEAATRLNQLNGAHGITQLGASHDYLSAHPRADQLAAATVSLDAMRAALEVWGRADFAAARDSLARAEEAAAAAERACQFNLGPYRAWLQSLVRASQTLIESLAQLRALSRRADTTTSDELCAATRQLLNSSRSLVGETYSHTVNAWHETSKAFAKALTSGGRRSLILAQLEELLRSPHIAQHPALSLFQRWFELTDRAPEFTEPANSPTDLVSSTARSTAIPATSPPTPARYVFSRPPRAQDENEYDDALAEPEATSVQETSRPKPIHARRLLAFVFAGTIVAVALTIVVALLVRMGENERAVQESAPTSLPVASTPRAALNSEIDVLSWLASTDERPLDSLWLLGEGEGWALTATSASAAAEVALTVTDLTALSGIDYRAVSAEFRYQAEAAAAGFGLRLRATDNALPAVSLLAQPASAGTIKLTLSAGDQYILREIYQQAVPIARISLRLDPSAGTVRAYYNETPLGGLISISGELLPALFVNANSSVRVLRWTITPA